jgi:ribosomal protein S18 acetylase RimI-like enzyme
MSTWRIENINQPSEEVYNYLNANSHVFIPSLVPRVDVMAFAQKIAVHAQQFWLFNSEKVSGFAACYFNDPAKMKGFITSISVTEETKGKGAGSLLLNEIIQYAKGTGFSQLSLEVFEENENAIAFYKKRGFNVTDNLGKKLLMNLEITANANN